MPPVAILAWAVRAAGTLGLAVSTALLIDYTRPAPTFCGDGGGCDVVRQSDYASLLGIPTPAFGVIFFAGLLLLTLLRRPRALLVWSAGGALAATGFIVIQASVLHAFCKLCMITDVTALVAFGLVAATRLRAMPTTPATRGAVAALALLAGAAPVGHATTTAAAAAVTTPAELPASIAREQRPGVVTVVEFLDFECPYCRKMHGQLTPILEEYGDKVRLVRKMVPLPGHHFALGAAAAWCCADEMGKGEEMADALMTATDLTPGNCERLAESLGLEVEAFRACVNDPRTIARIEADLADAKQAQVRALPTTWIGGTVYEGFVAEEKLRSGLDQALKSAAASGS